MDNSENLSIRDHTIDIPRNDVTSTSTSHQDNANLDQSHNNRVPSNEVPPVPESSGTDVSNSGSASDGRRDQGHRQQNPLNSVLWISIDFIVNFSQIIAGVCVLWISRTRNEHPHAPLFEWLLAYTIGCIATLPHLYWRYLHRNCRSTEQEPRPDSSERNTTDPESFHTASDFMDNSANSTGVSGSDSLPIASPRVYAWVACFKLLLDCFFAVWFVVGNVWIFGSRSSVHDAPNLYRICLVFLAFGFVGYLMPFVLCTMICCCLPCIISYLGFHEDMDMNRGAATEAINALVAYKYKSIRIRDGEVAQDGAGVLAAGTDKERTVSSEDAVCCICLSKFSNDEDLRELPCAHVFHMECVDKWLQINALCPLCKGEIGSSASGQETDSQNLEDGSRVRDDVESQR